MRILYKVFSWIIFSSIIASFLIIALLFIRRVFGKKLNPKLLNGLWIVILARLLIPITMNNEYSLSNIVSNIKEEDSIHEEADQLKIDLESGESIEEDSVVEDTRNNMLGTPVIKLNKRFIPVIWFGGVLISATFILTTIYRHKLRLKRMDRVEDGKVVTILKKYKKDMRIKEDVQVFTGDGDRGPYIIGIKKPKIFIPKSILEVLDERELECVILHELSHHKRKDLIVNNFQLLALVLHWFNPFIWMMSKFMREDREMACDDYVMEILGEERSLDYGLTMIDIARKNIGRKKTSLVSAYFLLNKEQVKRRIEMISNFKETTLKSKIAMVLSVLIIGGFVLTNGIGIASKVISPSKIEDNVTNRFEIETRSKQFYNLKRAKDFLDEDIKVPTKLPEGFDLEYIMTSDIKETGMDKTVMWFTDGGQNIYSIETSKDRASIFGNSISIITPSGEEKEIKRGFDNMKIGDIEGVFRKCNVEDADVEYSFIEKYNHSLDHHNSDFVWRDGDRYYSLSTLPDLENPKKFMFDFKSRETRDLINSFESINDVDEEDYISKRHENEFNIYNEKDLIDIEEKLGFEPKIILSLEDGYKAGRIGVISFPRLGSDDSDLTLDANYYKEKDPSDKGLYENLCLNQSKNSKTYDTIVEEGYEKLLKKEFPHDNHTIKTEKFKISGKDIYKAKIEFKDRLAMGITYYNWHDGDIYFQIDIRESIIADSEITAEDFNYKDVIGEIIDTK